MTTVLLDTQILVRTTFEPARLSASLNLTPAHILATVELPPIHKDPFDRILIAQAIVEDIQLLTANNLIAQ